jgi:hypothetical protein
MAELSEPDKDQERVQKNIRNSRKGVNIVRYTCAKWISLSLISKN